MGLQHPHTGPPCAACEWAQDHPTTWSPSSDFGVLIHASDGRLVEEGVLAARLLVP